LTAIETRFPISREKGHATVSFVWYDAFRPTKRTIQANIHFEKAAILFNLGAVLGQAGLNCDRTSGEGLQQACKLFQVRQTSIGVVHGVITSVGNECSWLAGILIEPAPTSSPCDYSQEAAGVFALLREGEANKVDSPRPTDLTAECVTIMEKLMLAQVGWVVKRVNAEYMLKELLEG
jgi:programmed cell death 6-interacting protein